jgi:hypothetical protein
VSAETKMRYLLLVLLAIAVLATLFRIYVI